MSENTSKKSLRQRETYKFIDSVCERAFKPEPFLTISEWADRFRMLSPKAVSEPGLWRTSRTPYLKEIMDCLSPHSPCRRVVFQKGAQVGGTEAGNNWIGYVIHIAPGPMMAISPTVELAKRNSKQRIAPLLEDTPELRNLVPSPRSKESGNTVLSKEFLGGILIMTGANSGVGLRSAPVRYLFLDEIDGYPSDVDGEGDPVILAEKRTATFKNRRKVFLVSTPTLKGLSRIVREFEASDKRYYYLPCPKCNYMQPLKFEQLRWKEGLPINVKYECIDCEETFTEHHKTEMLEKGKWIATKKGNKNTVGFHLSSLYSPIGWFGWDDAAAQYEQAKTYSEEMKGFVNTVLGEAYEEEFDAPEWKRIYERREDYKIGTVPRRGLFLTAGVDIQRNRIECEVVAWGELKESWSIDYILLDGDTAERTVWDKLKNVLHKSYRHENGQDMPIRVMAIDSGYATQDVYNWTNNFTQPVWGAYGIRANLPHTVVAIKGQDRDNALILSYSKAGVGKRKGLRVCNVSGPVAKGELYRWLKLEFPTEEEMEQGAKNPYGACHFPQYGEEYFKQLTAEKCIKRMHKGYPKLVWEKDPRRDNEALDCRVYARAAASLYGIDRFKEEDWKKFRKRLEKTISEEKK